MSPAAVQDLLFTAYQNAGSLTYNKVNLQPAC